MIRRAIPLILLILSVAGIIWFSQGLRVIDTIAMLACGLIAGRVARDPRGGLLRPSRLRTLHDSNASALCCRDDGRVFRRPDPPAAAPFPSGDVIDLSHTYDETTIFWPTSERFRPDKVSDGMTAGGYYYAANNFFTAEHGGTHLDAPVHFAQGAQTVDQIPLDRFVGTAVIVDVIAQSERHADYRRSSPRTSSAQNVG